MINLAFGFAEQNASCDSHATERSGRHLFRKLCPTKQADLATATKRVKRDAGNEFLLLVEEENYPLRRQPQLYTVQQSVKAVAIVTGVLP